VRLGVRVAARLAGRCVVGDSKDVDKGGDATFDLGGLGGSCRDSRFLAGCLGAFPSPVLFVAVVLSIASLLSVSVAKVLAVATGRAAAKV
jgi:hypothetical protein